MADTALLRAMNDHVLGFLRRVVADLSDEQVCYSAPDIDKRSIARVVVHAYSGSLAFTSNIAGKGWTRPAPVELTTTADVLAFLEKTHEQVEQALADLPEGALEQTYMMPWGREMVGIVALSGAFAHGIVHAGSIQGIRAIGGFPTPAES